jgi:hypothetical protein
VKKITYEEIQEFMDKYFKTYSNCNLEANNLDKMREFWAPEFEFEAYFDYYGYGKTPVIFSWKQMQADTEPQAARENLSCDYLIIDERRQECSGLLTSVLTDKKTGEVKLKAKLNSIYRFRRDENDKIKITRILVFEEYNPDTAKCDIIIHPDHKIKNFQLD